MRNLFKAESSVCAKALGGGGTVCAFLQRITVRNSSHNLFTPYKHLLPSLRQLFCCQKEEEEENGEKNNFQDARCPSPSPPPSCILQSASISASSPPCISFLHRHPGTPSLPHPLGGLRIAAPVIIPSDWKWRGQRGRNLRVQSVSPRRRCRRCCSLAATHLNRS